MSLLENAPRLTVPQAEKAAETACTTMRYLPALRAEWEAMAPETVQRIQHRWTGLIMAAVNVAQEDFLREPANRQLAPDGLLLGARRAAQALLADLDDRPSFQVALESLKQSETGWRGTESILAGTIAGALMTAR